MIDAPLLRGINLIDTPGVGGLQRGHGEVTMAALRTAQALLFVMDAGAPLSIPELSFLAEAARQTDTVVLVMTKIDLFPEWEKIRDDNRELIAQYAPAVVGAPILGVSSRLVEQASHLAADDSDAAKQVRAMSGLELVTDELRAKVIHRAQSRASDNRVRALRATLLDLRLQLGELPEHLANNPQRMDELVAERDRLRAFLYDPHTGVIDIHQRIHRIQRYVEREFYLQVSSLIQRYSTLVENYPSGELKEIPTLVKGELTHIIADRLDDLSKELSNIVEAVESRIGSVAVLVAVRKKFADEVEPEITVHSSAEDHPENLVAATTDAVRASSLLFIGGFFVAGPVGVAISLAATVTAGLRQFLNSKNSSRQQSLRLWLDRVERDVERVFDRACGERIDALQRALDVELPRLLEGRAKHIDRLTRSSQTSATTAVPSPADVDALLEMVGAKALVTEARSKEMP